MKTAGVLLGASAVLLLIVLYGMDDEENETALLCWLYLDHYMPRFFEAILDSDATYHVRVAFMLLGNNLHIS